MLPNDDYIHYLDSDLAFDYEAEEEYLAAQDTDYPEGYWDDEPDQFESDVAADANALRNIGWETDEDYGGYDYNDFDQYEG